MDEKKREEEEKRESIVFDFDESDCDVEIITEDETFLFQSAGLNFISDAFQESWLRTEIDGKNGRKVVEMKDTYGDIVLHALSFYYPKFYEDLEGS